MPCGRIRRRVMAIAVDFDGMANTAVSMLVERIKDEKDIPPRREIAGFSLVRGAST